MQLILASNSPRRRELLSQLCSDFTVIPSSFEEKSEGISAYETALSFAVGKATEVFCRYPHALVLGADTVVALRGELFGKPHDAEEAKRMLRKLSGNTHSVYTGVCLVGEGVFKKEVCETLVTFHSLSERQIEEYVKSGSPLDKAGAYGIQDGMLVKGYRGSYTNVVGLPMEVVKSFLEGYIC